LHRLDPAATEAPYLATKKFGGFYKVLKCVFKKFCDPNFWNKLGTTGTEAEILFISGGIFLL
jgi:hypothetical protein